MKGLKKIIAATIASAVMLASYTCQANIIVDYAIAPQKLIKNYSGLPLEIGSVYGTFSADFTNNTLTAVDMYINLFGDALYSFNNPIAFGSFTDPLFPGLTYYEANLSTTSIGIQSGKTFYMDFTQNDTTHLFWGNTSQGGVFTSFGDGGIILQFNNVPEPNIWLITLMGIAMGLVYRKKHPTILKSIPV